MLGYDCGRAPPDDPPPPRPDPEAARHPRTHLPQAAVSRIERDLVSPSVSTLAELLRLMNEELVLDAREVDWGHDLTLVRRNLDLPGRGSCPPGSRGGRLVTANAGVAHMTDAELDPGPIFSVLEKHGVDFVVIGGLAGLAHGRGIRPTTQTSRTPERGKNVERLAARLQELQAKPGAPPPDVPFVLRRRVYRERLELHVLTRSAPSTSSVTRLAPWPRSASGERCRDHARSRGPCGVARPPDRGMKEGRWQVEDLPRRERVPRHPIEPAAWPREEITWPSTIPRLVADHHARWTLLASRGRTHRSWVRADASTPPPRAICEARRPEARPARRAAHAERRHRPRLARDERPPGQDGDDRPRSPAGRRAGCRERPRRRCGSGGAAKDGVVEIQGDHRARAARLEAQGYRVKLAGG